MNKAQRTIFQVASFMIAFAFLGSVIDYVGAAPDIEDLKIEINKRSEKIQELEAQIRETKNTIGDLQKSERTLANEIARLDAQIKALYLDIALTEEQIGSLNLELERISLEIKQLEDKLYETKKQTAGILRSLQETAEYASPVTLVFSSESFSEVFDNLTAGERLEAELILIIRDLKTTKQTLEEKRIMTEKKKQELETFRETLAVQNSILISEQDDREDLLYTTNRQENQFRQTLKTLEVQQQTIEKEIIQFDAQLRRLVNPSALPSKGALSWPTDVVRITQYYGSTASTGFINDHYLFHNGIDIAPPSGIGTPIKAAASGTIIGMGNLGRLAYGKWIAVDHRNGLITLYAHLSKQAAQLGQSVQNGDVIGYEGSTGFSTGPHLHFTVYASETFRIEERSYGLLPVGASLNPMDFLE